MLEIRWQRGHDPEIQVMRCIPPPRDAKRPPKIGQEVSPALMTESLSRYDRTTLHYFMQCHGMFPVRHTDATPLVESAVEACLKLPEPSSWSWIGLLVLLASCLAGLGLLARWLRGGGPVRGLAKAKQEDEGLPSVDAGEF